MTQSYESQSESTDFQTDDPLLKTDPVGGDFRTIRKNFSLGVVNGLLYNTAETILDPTLVLVTFLSTLTQSPILLGLVIPIRDGAWSLPQLWVSSFLQNYKRKIIFYRRVAYIRITSWALLAITINFVTNRDSLLWAFFLIFTISSLAAGLGGLPFLAVVGKTIPANRRGEFFSWRLGLGGLAGIGASFLVQKVLAVNSPFAFPHNYGLLAAGFFVFASVGITVYNWVEEPVDQDVLPRVSVIAQLQRARKVLKKDVDFRRFIILQSMLIMAGSATPFFAVFVQEQLKGNKAMVGVYLAILTITNLIANLIFGRLSRKIGTRKILIYAAFIGIIMSSLMLALGFLALPLHMSSSLASYCLIPVFILWGIRNTGVGVSVNSLLLAVAPPDDRSMYIGFTNSFLGLVLLLSGASGLMMQLFGFQFLVGFTLIAHLASFILIRKISNQGI